MLDLRMVDVAISLALVYMMMAGVVSGLQEWLSNLLNLRGRYLMKGIASLLHQKTQTLEVAAVFEPSQTEPRPRVQTETSVLQAPSPYILNVRRIFNAPAIDALRDGETGKLPSYIPSGTFALVLANYLVKDHLKAADKDQDGKVSAQELMLAVPEAVAQMPDSRLKLTLQTLLSNTERSSEAIQQALETHYNQVMERVSGWYKRHVQRLAFWIALAITITLNVNTLAIIDHLNNHPAKAAELAGRMERELDRLAATQAVEEPAPVGLAPNILAGAASGAASDALANPSGSAAANGQGVTLEVLRGQVEQLHQVGLPMGWQLAGHKLLPVSQWPGWLAEHVLSLNALVTLLGWLITAAAATLGAPFWFDMLSRLVSLRSSGRATVASLQADGTGGRENSSR